MTPREAIFLRHHGLPVCKQSLRPTDFHEWIRPILCCARQTEPQLFDASGRIRNHDTFTRWLEETHPPKEAV